MAMALVVDLIISSAPPGKTGSVAAAQQISGELGTALGIALSGTVATAVYRSSLASAMPLEVPGPAADTALSSVHGGVTAAESVVSGGPALLDAVHRAVTAGLQAYTGLGAALLVAVGGLVTLVLVREDARPAPGP